MGATVSVILPPENYQDHEYDLAERVVANGFDNRPLNNSPVLNVESSLSPSPLPPAWMASNPGSQGRSKSVPVIAYEKQGCSGASPATLTKLNAHSHSSDCLARKQCGIWSEVDPSTTSSTMVSTFDSNDRTDDNSSANNIAMLVQEVEAEQECHQAMSFDG